jgi:ketosteroid isomerase-like protein
MQALLKSTLVCLAFVGQTIPAAKAQDISYITAPSRLSAEDDATLRQVIARLNHALDAADYPLYGSFFSEDGVFVSGFGDAIGPDQVATALEKVAPFITNKRHVAGNLVISGEGDRAVVTSYLIVFEREADLAYVGSAINIDTMVRENGRWLVEKHESTLDPATERYIQQQMEQQQ